jgi:hypothetical protein
LSATAALPKFEVTFTGTDPLIMHADTLVDPLHPLKLQLAELTKKGTRRTEAEHRESYRLEFLASLYVDPIAGVYVPGRNVKACMIKSATEARLGTRLRQALVSTSRVNPLDYRGRPQHPEATVRMGIERPEELEKFNHELPQLLWEAGTFHLTGAKKQGQAKVMRTRAYFPDWRLSVTGYLDTARINQGDFETIVQRAGLYYGLGDDRPDYGRFTAQVEWGK